MRKLFPAIALSLGLTTAAGSASAFSTRVHIMIANKVREALIESGSDKVQLKFGSHSVVLTEADAKALMNEPLAFRAGAIGPDNMIFPGMTDPSHAIEQRPFEQCELLYKEAITDAERAYAMGCFLHGSTDAIAHHYVNHMSGETFTLTPLSTGMQSSYGNVVRHIVAESMIQKAALTLDPQAFGSGQLFHSIPKGFVLRTYFDESNPVWQRMAEHPKAKFEAAIAANPGASLGTIVANSGLAAAEHLVLTPTYIRLVDSFVPQLQDYIEGRIAEMQDWSTPEGNELQLLPGPDGQLGTKDDDALCSASCPYVYAEYFTYVGLLAPRYDANNNPLPSAFEKITGELRVDLSQFLPALVDTVENVSSKMNGPIAPGDNGLSIQKSDVAAAFAPVNTWADDVTNIDYETLSHAVIPEWIIQLSDTFQNVGVNVDIAGILKSVFSPIVQPIKDAIKVYAIDQAQVFIGGLIDEYEVQVDGVTAEYQGRLDAAAAPGLSGNVLDHFYTSGLFGHSFNIAATAIANHAAVLPVGDDPVGVGPASFDASHTPSWMQAGVCSYLQKEVFPLGIDLKGVLSVREDKDYPAQIDEDSPIECHDGSLFEFTDTPTVPACAVTKVDALIADPGHEGSTSRAYPPQFSAKPAECENIVVPGLPGPPPVQGTGGAGGGGGNGAGGGGDGGDGGAGGGDKPDAKAGCSCEAVGSTGGAPAWPLVGVLLPLVPLLRRRRKARAAVGAALLASAIAVGCGGGGGSDTTTSGTTGDPTGTGGMGGMGATTGTGGAGAGVTSSTSDASSSSTGMPSKAKELLDALGTSVWSGTQTRNGKTRAYELRFEASSLLWAEIQNPFGPARKRQMRAFNVEADGATVHSTVLTPAGWEADPENGKKDDWTFEVIPGSPRKLRTTRAGKLEEFTEGAWPAPTSGLTAEVRVFESGGLVDKAFCTSGFNNFNYGTLFDFARGKSAQPVLGYDVVAGAELVTWHDGSGNNQFAITNVAGFDTLGGTLLSDQYNFVVRYTGTIQHPGGDLWMREQDDQVEDGVWAFIGPGVGSNNTNDIFLEVHGFAWADATDDEVVANGPAGDADIEIIVIRCAKQISDVDVEIAFGNAPWQLVGDAPSDPLISDTLFPPAL